MHRKSLKSPRAKCRECLQGPAEHNPSKATLGGYINDAATVSMLSMDSSAIIAFCLKVRSYVEHDMCESHDVKSQLRQLEGAGAS